MAFYYFVINLLSIYQTITTFNLLDKIGESIRKMLSQIILYAVIAMFIGISQSAGVGGGPVLNICLMIGMGYSAKDSMSITYVFLMGGACASLIKNYKKVNSTGKCFIVDYNLAIITLPMIASGSLFGTLTNHFLSEFAVTILFVILLTYLCVNTYQKLKKFSNNQCCNQTSPLLKNCQQLQSLEPTLNPQLQQLIKQDLNPLPKDKCLIIGFVFLYTLLILLIKGGHHYDSIIGLPKCGFVGNILVLVHLGLSYCCSKSLAHKIIQKDIKKQQLGFNFDDQCEKMSQKKVWNCILSGFCAGLIGGALGLGGAIILVPVWLNSGISQIRATSTSPPLIFFSALISFSICYLSGRYKNFMELSFYFGLAYIGSAVVKAIITIITQKYQLKTMVFILLLITMASSLITLLPYQLFKFYKDPQQFIMFGNFC